MPWEPSRPRPPRTDWQQQRNERHQVVVAAATEVTLAEQQMRAAQRSGYADHLSMLMGKHRLRGFGA